MNRRELLGTSIASLLSLPWVEIQGKTMKEKTTSLYNFLEPHQLFTKEKLQDGVAPEYPLDFSIDYKHTNHIYSLTNNGKKPYLFQGEIDYILIPIYEIGASIDFEKYRDMHWAGPVLQQFLINKVNVDSLNILKYSCKETIDCTKSKLTTEKEIVAKLQSLYPKNIKLVKYIYNNIKYIYAIDNINDNLIMPIRIEPTIYRDHSIRNRIGFWAHMEYGLASLKPLGTMAILNKEPHELNTHEETMLPYKEFLK